MMEAHSYETGSLDRARKIIETEQPLIDRMQPVSPDVAVWLASAKGMVALLSENEREALAQFQSALDKGHDLASLDAGERLNLKQRVAFTDLRLGNAARAEKLFRELASGYASQEGPDSADVLRTRLNVGQALMAQGKHADAVRETAALYPRMMATFGPSHELTLQTLATKAQSEGALQEFGAAERDDLQLANLAVAKQGAGSFFAIAGFADASTAECRSGRIAEGLQNAGFAYQSALKAFGPKAGLTGASAYTLANCEIKAQRFDDAEKLLNSFDVAVVSQLTADADWGANVDLSRAEIALARHDLVGASRQLQLAAPALTKPLVPDPYQKRVYLALRSTVDASLAGKH